MKEHLWMTEIILEKSSLQSYTQSQKKCTMNSLASPVTQGQVRFLRQGLI